MEIILNDDNFEQEVLKSDKPVLVDFWAEWCGPCKMQGPVLKEFSEKHTDVKVCKLNVDDYPSLTVKYKVVSIPMLALFKNGELVKTEVGYHTINQLENMIL